MNPRKRVGQATKRYVYPIHVKSSLIHGSNLAFDVKQPDKVQKNLMQRTALHILSSPNPAQLEMRILANHGADHRFAFLRGRWSRHWKAVTDHARTEILKRDEPAGLGELAGYGSDDDSDGDKGEQG